MNELVFLELTEFHKWVRKNRLSSAVERLKVEIVANPDVGDVIPGGGGIRKVRMAARGRGKSGGYRVIYVLVVNRTVAVLIDGYSKSEQDDLSPDEIRVMARMVPDIEAIAIEHLRQHRPESEE